MLDALRSLGLVIDEKCDGTELKIVGCSGTVPAREAQIFVGNSGTTIRFLTAMLATTSGSFRLDGVPRMRERPIADLVTALQSLGANLRTESAGGCPPVVIEARGMQGGSVAIRGDISSQYLSGLMMAAPYAEQDVTIHIEGKLVSVPYVRMTQSVMESFGARVTSQNNLSTIRVDHTAHYSGRSYAIEPDASAASYFWAAAAITQGNVIVEGLSNKSIQGDVRFCQCLAQMGCQVSEEDAGLRVAAGPLRGIDVSMNDISDTVQTLAAVALFATGPTRIRDVGHIRHKETDRIRDLACELRRFGAQVDEHEDGLTIFPPQSLHGATIETYDDHRMAMSMSLVGLRVPDVHILNPGCTAKTYPRYFEDLQRACGTNPESND